jgi:O-antigen/teichoic acid export membrane protein
MTQRSGREDDAMARERISAGTENGASAISATGKQLMRRAPTGYLWNQAGSLWLFVSLLLFEVVVRRSLPQAETNVFDLVSALANLAFYIASLGLANAGTVYLPRTLAEEGPGQALALAIRLTVVRIAMAALVGVVVLVGLPALAGALSASGWAPGVQLTHSFTVRELIAHRVVIAVYAVAVSMSTLFSALLVSLVYTRVTFIFGSLSQLALLGLTYLLVHSLGLGTDGAILAQALPPMVTLGIFAALLWRRLGMKPNRGGTRYLGQTMKLSIASWLADLPNSSLVQPVALGQVAAAQPSQLLYFKSTYQMGDAGARFFTDGLGGVSLAIMSTSYAGKHLRPLAVGWRTVSKLQVLLALPLVVFCVPHAGAIMALLFGQLYAHSGPLLAVFLILNGLIQLLGGSTHEWALYVLGRQQWVVVSRWATLGILALAGAVLVPRYYALGALIAVGVGRLAAEVFLLALARRWVRRPYPVTFVAKLLLTLALPAAVTTIWQPTGLLRPFTAGLRWLGPDFAPVLAQGLLLVVEVLIFFAIFLVCMRLVRPLDAEDVALLNQVPRWLRKALLPFAARKRTAGAPEPPTGESVPAAEGALSPGAGAGVAGPARAPEA